VGGHIQGTVGGSLNADEFELSKKKNT